MRNKLFAGVGVVFALACGVFLTAPSSFAAGRYGDSTTNYVKPGDTVDGAVYFAGNDVHIEGTVNGDVNCAAQTIVITGTVNGDVNCAGVTVSVRGKVTGDVRVAGENVTLGGEIGGSASAFAKTTVTVETAARIGRDAVLSGSEVLMNGSVGRDIVATGQTGVINGPVSRDVEGIYDNLTVGKDAVIGGFLHYASSTDAQINGTVNGDVKRDENSKYSGRQAGLAVQGFAMWTFLVVVWVLLIALALRLAFPKKMHTATSISPRDVILATAIGLVSIIVVPMVVITLMASVIALPLGIALILVWLALCAVSAGVTAIYLGRVLFAKQKMHPVSATALAALGLGVLFIIPFVNMLAILGSLAFGTGALLYAIRGEYEANGRGPKVKLVKAQ